ncbi:hypothetical protein B0H15DRAFT_564114 [Mycena belliarum]|uniref:Uncharacterized protein n=1 Tax=Mycena belliarum TaxID=1033014 RepID=A0AAD6XGG3_9AGAR|nr:hypothetical protein B0H15DRAFT_564114 [Mycena belliae]
MIPCPNCDDSHDPVLETSQATPTAIPARSFRRYNAPSRRVNHATETVVVLVGVQTQHVSGAVPSGPGRGLLTRTPSLDASRTTTPSVKVPTSISDPSIVSSVSPRLPSVTATHSSPGPSGSASSSASTDLKAGSETPQPAVTGNGTVVHATASSTATPLSTRHPVPIGTILGAVIAGVLTTALVLLLLFLWMKRRSCRTTTTPTIQQYPFATPVVDATSPRRPARQRGDSLGSAIFY